MWYFHCSHSVPSRSLCCCISNSQTTRYNNPGLEQLEELYLAQNSICSPKGLQHLKSLNTLDISSNQFDTSAGLECLSSLTDLWMGSNNVEAFEALEPLQNLPKLTCLYLEHCPLSKDFEYRKRTKAMLPRLQQIDATACNVVK